MSDNRNTDDPSAYGHTPATNDPDAASRPGVDSAPPAPGAAGPTPPAPPYGAPSGGAPAYGAPAYGAPSYDRDGSVSSAQPSGAYPDGQHGYGAPAYGYGAAPRVNPLAIVALVSSLVGLFLIPVIGQIAGIITGHISLKQIKTTGERGRGMALAGVLIGYISLGLGILLIILTAVIIATTGGSDVRYGA